jgi:acyl dehydratase
MARDVSAEPIATPADGLPVDPTGYRPMQIVSSPDIPVGFELEPITKTVTLDKSRIYQGWPAVRNRHTDYPAAQATSLREPNINGGQLAEYVGELFIKFFGAGFVGGSLAISFIGFVSIDDTVTARGIVREREIDGGRVRLTLDVWLENQRGDKVLVGTASGFAGEAGPT